MPAPRPISNKTRIETQHIAAKPDNQRNSQTDFQQNKDWNVSKINAIQNIKHTPRPISNKTRIETRLAILQNIDSQDSQTDFQQNKDWNPPAAAGWFSHQ